MKPKTWPLLVAVCCLHTGCIGLSREHAIRQWGIRAKLVDAIDAKTLSQRHVVIAIDGKESSHRTNYRGYIQTPTSSISYWTWLGGPALSRSQAADISISTANYRAYLLKWDQRESRRPEEAKVVDPAFGRPYLDLGVVKLERLQQGVEDGQPNDAPVRRPAMREQ